MGVEWWYFSTSLSNQICSQATFVLNTMPSIVSAKCLDHFVFTVPPVLSTLCIHDLSNLSFFDGVVAVFLIPYRMELQVLMPGFRISWLKWNHPWVLEQTLIVDCSAHFKIISLKLVYLCGNHSSLYLRIKLNFSLISGPVCIVSQSMYGCSLCFVLNVIDLFKNYFEC